MSLADGSAAVDVKDTAPITDAFSRQKSMNPNDPDRFKYGVLIRGKFIGVEDVKEDHGDELCKNSMIKLKAIVLAKKEHKQRICIKITLDGVEILDERTNQPIFNHSVSKISYIARDVSDPRAIGYIYKNGKDSYQYFAIKTLGQAQELFNTLKELFEVVLEMRNKEKQNGAQPKETKSSDEPAAAAAAAATATNDSEISTLQDKIKQMNEQPEPSLFDLGGNDALTSIEDAPQSPAPAAVAAAAEPPKKSSNELFDLFDSPPDTSANNKPPVDPKYAMLANEISTLNSLSSTPPRSAPIPQMQGYGAAQNPFPMQQQPQPFNMGMQQPFNNPMQMQMQANNPFNFGAMPAQQQQPFPNQMMGGMRMNTPMTQPAQNGAFMTPPRPQFQPQQQPQQQQFNNNPLW